MGEKNSSYTRVRPLMDSIQEKNYDKKLAMKLLSLMKEGYIENPFKRGITDIGEIKEIYYSNNIIGKKEKSLRPSSDRLLWLIENLKEANGGRKISGKSEHTIENRLKLMSKDKALIQKAKDEVLTHSKNESWPRKKWWVLEGDTHPDILIETDRYIFIGEAKRTESHLTKDTEWDKERSQMVRHIEGALLFAKDNQINAHVQQVICFYILDDDNMDKFKKDLALTQAGDQSMWENSLKHIVQKEDCIDKVNQIKNTYIGYTTWQTISAELGIKYVD